MGAKKSKEVLSREELEYIMDKTKLEEHIVKNGMWTFQETTQMEK